MKVTSLFEFLLYLALMIVCFLLGLLTEGILARGAFLSVVHSSYSDSIPVRNITEEALEGIPLRAESVRFA